MVNSLLIKRLLEIKKKLNIRSQQDFADYLSISRSVISNIERGKREPSKEILMKLASQCNINGHWLLTGEGSMFLNGEEDNTNKKALFNVGDIVELISGSKPMTVVQVNSKEITL